MTKPVVPMTTTKKTTRTATTMASSILDWLIEWSFSLSIISAVLVGLTYMIGMVTLATSYIDGRRKDAAMAVLKQQLAATDKAEQESSPRPALRPIRDITPDEVQGSIERWVAFNSNAPSVSDINTLYGDTDLSDQESDALLAQRAAGTARPTVPLTRFPRP